MTVADTLLSGFAATSVARCASSRARRRQVHRARVDVTAIVETDPAEVGRVCEAAAEAGRRCLFTSALECPVRIRVDAGAQAPAA